MTLVETVLLSADVGFARHSGLARCFLWHHPQEPSSRVHRHLRIRIIGFFTSCLFLHSISDRTKSEPRGDFQHWITMITPSFGLDVEQLDSRAATSVVTPITEQFPPLTRSGRGLVAAASVMIVLTTTWTVMRIVSRNLRKTQYQVEDYLYFVGQVCFCFLGRLESPCGVYSMWTN